MGMEAPQTFITPTGIARRASVHPAVVQRLLAQSVITADAFIEIGGKVMPVLLETRVSDVLRGVEPRKIS